MVAAVCAEPLSSQGGGASLELNQGTWNEPHPLGVGLFPKTLEIQSKLLKNIIGDEMGLSKDLGLPYAQIAFFLVQP